MSVWTDVMKSAAMKDAAQVCKLTARIAELEKALEPFARMAESYTRCRGSLVIASARGTILSVYDLRAAASLLPKSDSR